GRDPEPHELAEGLFDELAPMREENDPFAHREQLPDQCRCNQGFTSACRKHEEHPRYAACPALDHAGLGVLLVGAAYEGHAAAPPSAAIAAKKSSARSTSPARK